MIFGYSHPRPYPYPYTSLHPRPYPYPYPYTNLHPRPYPYPYTNLHPRPYPYPYTNLHPRHIVSTTTRHYIHSRALHRTHHPHYDTPIIWYTFNIICLLLDINTPDMTFPFPHITYDDTPSIEIRPPDTLPWPVTRSHDPWPYKPNAFLHSSRITQQTI